MTDKPYYVYIITNQHHTTLYTGVTNNLVSRMMEHKSGMGSGFSHKYNLTKLVYFECAMSALSAINREKQIKSGSRKKKIALINSINPDWNDLFEEL